MTWRGPEFEGEMPSLGWSLLDWGTEVLSAPNDPSKPFVFTDEQAMLLVDWFTIDPRNGSFIYRRGYSRRSKGYGKSPMEAFKAIAELCGDVRFDGWDAHGEPVGRPWGLGKDPTNEPWVQVAAVSEDQTMNTYGAIYQFLTDNDGRSADLLGIDAGLTRCFMRGSRPGKIEPVTAAAGSREGQRVTYAVLDETHLWTPRNGGKKLSRTLLRNVAKMDGRSYETTNSFRVGDESVAEASHKAWSEGRPGIFCDAVEAPPVTTESTDAELKSALEVAYGGAKWVNLDRLVQEMRDPEVTWEDSRRYYLNWNVADSNQGVDQAKWAGLKDVSVVIPPGTRIGLGFDGSLSNDATALIGCAILDDLPILFNIAVWLRPQHAGHDWRIPRLEVNRKVHETFEYFNVGQMLCDPPMWQTDIETWAEKYGDETVVFFDTNQPRRMAFACDRFRSTVEEGSLRHDGDPTLSSHVLAMFRKTVRINDDESDGRTKFVFVKPPDKRKIDAGIGAVLALEAAMTMPEDTGPIVMEGRLFA